MAEGKVWVYEFKRIEKNILWDFPGGPVVKTLHLLCRGLGSIPSQRSNIPHAVGGQEKRKEKHSPTESNILKFWFRINEFR